MTDEMEQVRGVKFCVKDQWIFHPGTLTHWTGCPGPHVPVYVPAGSTLTTNQP